MHHFPEVSGRTLVDVLRSDWGNAQTLVPGLGVAFYFEVVLQLDDHEFLTWIDSTLKPRSSRAKLTPMVPLEHGVAPGLVFRGRQIVCVRTDAVGDPFLELDNGLGLQVTVDLGVQILVQPIPDFFER